MAVCQLIFRRQLIDTAILDWVFSVTLFYRTVTWEEYMKRLAEMRVECLRKAYLSLRQQETPGFAAVLSWTPRSVEKGQYARLPDTASVSCLALLLLPSDLDGQWCLQLQIENLTGLSSYSKRPKMRMVWIQAGRYWPEYSVEKSKAVFYLNEFNEQKFMNLAHILGSHELNRLYSCFMNISVNEHILGANEWALKFIFAHQCKVSWLAAL